MDFFLKLITIRIVQPNMAGVLHLQISVVFSLEIRFWGLFFGHGRLGSFCGPGVVWKQKSPAIMELRSLTFDELW